MTLLRQTGPSSHLSWFNCFKWIAAACCAPRAPYCSAALLTSPSFRTSTQGIHYLRPEDVNWEWLQQCDENLCSNGFHSANVPSLLTMWLVRISENGVEKIYTFYCLLLPLHCRSSHAFPAWLQVSQITVLLVEARVFSIFWLNWPLKVPGARSGCKTVDWLRSWLGWVGGYRAYWGSAPGLGVGGHSFRMVIARECWLRNHV